MKSNSILLLPSSWRARSRSVSRRSPMTTVVSPISRRLGRPGRTAAVVVVLAPATFSITIVVIVVIVLSSVGIIASSFRRTVTSTATKVSAASMRVATVSFPAAAATATGTLSYTAARFITIRGVSFSAVFARARA